MNSQGLADGVIYYDADGNIQEQKANAVVLACNGVGTPRLMLNSRSPQFPDGIANSSGLVGKNLMFHPYSILFGTFDERIDGNMGPLGANLISQEFYETDLSRGFVRGYAFQVNRGFGRSPPPATAMARGGCPGARTTIRRLRRNLDIRSISPSSAKTCLKSTTG